uniref:BURP domain-containing protein n=1 Tax=Kalanchoe fedtschenkoi TaxID=63787 RepID=A0A7N0SZM5_KALFE
MCARNVTAAANHGTKEELDSSEHIFFKLSDLRLGQTMAVYFPKRDSKASPEFLPKQDADAVPFSSADLQRLLSLFNFSPASPQAEATRIKVLTTTHLKTSKTRFQNYTINENPEEVHASRVVSCHTMPYPYAVYYCHSLKSGNKVFRVSLLGQNGDLVKAVGVCHLDTSQWNPDHVLFRVLNVKPGESPVCHFVPADNLIWVPKLDPI